MVEPEPPGGGVTDEAGIPYVVYVVRALVPDLAPDGEAGDWEKAVGTVTAKGPDQAIELVAEKFPSGSQFRAIAQRNLGPIRTWVEQTRFGLQ